MAVDRAWLEQVRTKNQQRVGLAGGLGSLGVVPPPVSVVSSANALQQLAASIQARTPGMTPQGALALAKIQTQAAAASAPMVSSPAPSPAPAVSWVSRNWKPLAAGAAAIVVVAAAARSVRQQNPRRHARRSRRR